MSRASLTSLSAAILLALAGAAPSAAAVHAPAWSISSWPVPTNFKPGGEGAYEVTVVNSGGAPADGTPLTITDTLPAGLTVNSVELPLLSAGEVSDFGSSLCDVESSGETQTVICEIPSALPEAQPASVEISESRRMVVHVAIPSAASGQLTNMVQVEGGGAPASAVSVENDVSSEPSPAGFQEFRAALTGPDGQLAEAAGSHPYQYTTSFAVNTNAAPPGASIDFIPAEGDVKDVEVKLPPGLVGDPTAVPRCTAQQFSTFSDTEGAHLVNSCPDDSAVGIVVVRQLEGKGAGDLVSAPVYNLVPPKGMPAQFGFQVAVFPFFIDTSLRSGGDYGVSAHLRNTSQIKRVTAASVTVWGVPADESHDSLRGTCLNNGDPTKPLSLCESPAEVEPKPFLRLPTSCSNPLFTEMIFNRWNDHDAFQQEGFLSPAPGSCDQLDFEPTLKARPTTNVADSPTGLSAQLHIPQNEDPKELGEADVRKVAVTLPEGLVVNPSGANGLAACSSAQIELKGPAPARCPDASKIGTVEVETPLLDHTVKGAVYVAAPHDNPFNSLLAIYIAVDDPQTGVVVKLAGHVQADPRTGRLTTVFDENPQLPFEDFTLEFFQGPLAPLRTPAVCATYSTTSVMTPWSAPESGPPVTPSDTYSISEGANGSPCATSEAALPNSPAFDAGTRAPVAGAFSPFVVRLRREDGSQQFSSVSLSPPPGLVGKLAGIPYCPESALAAAAAKAGNAEKANPSCPAASELGTVDVGAGAGPSPFYAQGRAYLTGPYKGAPLSMAIVTPATAGPYDLGTVVVRTALYVDPETARITAKSDPIPSILQGVPLDVRTIEVKIDRPNFILNPTNCDPLSIVGQSISTLGQPAPLASRFQLGECGRLGFAPKLSTRLFGKTNRGAHPKFKAVLTMPPGGANIARTAVTLPRSEFLDQGHIRTICTRVQFAAGACPEGSIYGFAVAETPLLDEPLRGPVYLRSSSNPLPDLVVALRGQVDIALVGRVDSVRGGIRTVFQSVPDAPVSRFVLTMRGGSRGLLQNSTNICRRKHRLHVFMDSQSGKVHDSRPLLRNTRCKQQRRKR
ncbi:MAG TPA: hypothetical protein VNT92_05710 [Acidimicrobiia bacterium]|nr:hypothetical protein [Acidimicrobiia bacterium]